MCFRIPTRQRWPRIFIEAVIALGSRWLRRFGSGRLSGGGEFCNKSWAEDPLQDVQRGQRLILCKPSRRSLVVHNEGPNVRTSNVDCSRRKLTNREKIGLINNLNETSVKGLQELSMSADASADSLLENLFGQIVDWRLGIGCLSVDGCVECNDYYLGRVGVEELYRNSWYLVERSRDSQSREGCLSDGLLARLTGCQYWPVGSKLFGVIVEMFINTWCPPNCPELRTSK